MKNIKKMNDIAAIATAKVNELTAKGFIFNFGTMAGSQGDDFKADLTKNVIAPEKVIEKIRAHRGYKRAQIEDIKRIVRNNNGKVTYIVEFKNLVSKTANYALKLN